MEKLTNIIEGILFASGDAVPVDLLREKLGVSKRDVDTAIRQLEKKYSEDCGIRLLNFNHKLQFATNPDYKDTISLVLTPIRERNSRKRFWNARQLSLTNNPSPVRSWKRFAGRTATTRSRPF